MKTNKNRYNLKYLIRCMAGISHLIYFRESYFGLTLLKFSLYYSLPYLYLLIKIINFKYQKIYTPIMYALVK